MKKILAAALSLLMLLSVITSGFTVFAESAGNKAPQTHREGKCLEVSVTEDFINSGRALLSEDVPELDVDEIIKIFSGEDYGKISYLIFINDLTQEAFTEAIDYLKTLDFVTAAEEYYNPPEDSSKVDKTVLMKNYHDDKNWKYDGERLVYIVGGISMRFTKDYFKYNGKPTEEDIKKLFPDIEIESAEFSGTYGAALSIKNPSKKSTIEACDYLNSFDFVELAEPNIGFDSPSHKFAFITGTQSDYYTDEKVKEIINNYHDADKWHAKGKSGYVADKGIKVLFTDEFAQNHHTKENWKEFFPEMGEFSCSVKMELDDQILRGYYLHVLPENADKESVIKACDYLNSLDFVLLAEPEYLMDVSDDPVIDDPAEKPAPDPAPEKPSESDPTGDPLVEISVIALACAVMITILVTYNCKKKKTN